jgi:hypothetical protein
MPLYPFIVLEVGNALPSPSFRNYTLVNPQVGSPQDLGVRHQELDWQFDSWPLKVRNHPDFLTCRWCATYCWKVLDKGYNFAWNLISIEGLHIMLWAPKVARVLDVGISRLPSGSPMTKWHLGASLVDRHKVYYKGEGGGFAQIQAVVSLLSPSSPRVSPSTKNAPTMY